MKINEYYLPNYVSYRWVVGYLKINQKSFRRSDGFSRMWSGFSFASNSLG